MPPQKHTQHSFYIWFFGCWAYFLQYVSTADPSSETPTRFVLYSIFRMLSILCPKLSNGICLTDSFYIVFFVCWAYFLQYFFTASASSEAPPRCILYCIFRMLSILSPIVLNGRCLPRNVHNLKKSRDRCRRVADWVGLPKGGARWSHAIQLKNTVNRQSLRNSHCPQTVGSLRTCSRNVRTAKFTSTGKHRGSLKRIFYLMMWRSPAHHNIKQSSTTSKNIRQWSEPWIHGSTPKQSGK